MYEQNILTVYTIFFQPYPVPEAFNTGKSQWDDTIPRSTLNQPLPPKPTYHQANVPAGQPQDDDRLYYNDPQHNKEPPISGLVNKDKHYVNQEVVEKHARANIDYNSNKTPAKPMPVPGGINRSEPVKYAPIYQNNESPIETETRPTTESNIYQNTKDITSVLRRVVEDARRLPYFHRYTSRQTAEQFLKENGDYLIRDSSLSLNEELKNICLSVRTSNSVCQHIVLIQQTEPFITTRDRQYQTIQDLLAYNENRPLEMPSSFQSDPVCIKRAIMYKGNVEI
jgi:hypothetical protein